MDQTQKNQNPAPKPQVQQPKRPNEVGSFSVEGFVKIFDPETKEVFVEKRA